MRATERHSKRTTAGPTGVLAQFGREIERRTGISAKHVLPAELVGLGLLVAVIGMYWDIGWHVDFGRDEKIFTLPHTMIVLGIGTCLVGACMSMMLPGPESRGSLKFGRHALPAGGLILLLCSSVALMAFPLDDLWHRLFGEDVTLWSPTHILMIGGASLCSLGIIVLVSEAAGSGDARPPSIGRRIRQYVGCGGFLVALSTLQAEFDFGVPQFQMLYQPIMIALAAGVALVFARATLGPFGAIGAMLGFYAIRGGLALLVGVGLDHTLPYFPLYMASALCVEVVALVRWRSPLAFGAVAGLAVGTLGFGTEWAWTHVFMPHAWSVALLPQAAILSAVAGTAAGVVGARIAAAVGTRDLPSLVRGRSSTALVAAAVAAIVVALAIPLPRHGDPSVSATIVPFDSAGGSTKVRASFSKPDYSKNAELFAMFAWQGGSSKQIRLRQLSPTEYVTTDDVPYGDDWKTMLRVQHGSKVVGAPVFLPTEPLTNRPALPLARRTVPMERDTELLMRESKQGASALTTPAYVAVVLIVAGWLAAVAFALSRLEPPRPPRGATRGHHTRATGRGGLEH